MKNIYKVIFTITLSLFGISASAQNVEGAILDSENNPLIGASVWWANTTVGEAANVDGNFSIHRVKGYDMLVASYLGYQNDTLRVESGVNRVTFNLSDEGVNIEDIVVESHLGGNYISYEGIAKN